MRNVIVLFCLLSLGWAKDVKQVQVMATRCLAIQLQRKAAL
jgi:hypothetical protein